MTTVRAVLIAGPTASGKSALALELAERFGGVIVNADSMQVYRDLRIITARPTPEEEKRTTHRLYGFVDAAENYSVGRWCRDVEEALKEARCAGPHADPGWWHRTLFQGADDRTRRCAANTGGYSSRGPKPITARGPTEHCTQNLPGSIPRRRNA